MSIKHRKERTTVRVLGKMNDCSAGYFPKSIVINMPFGVRSGSSAELVECGGLRLERQNFALVTIKT